MPEQIEDIHFPGTVLWFARSFCQRKTPVPPAAVLMIARTPLFAQAPIVPPAARLTDPHVCPMVTVLVPHVGGPITGPGAPTVLIGGMPAAVVGDLCVCVGPPDAIAMGSTTVLIGGKPAARMGDPTAHGGSIVMGCPTVLIGG
jgi:uncharacterized Zn-binding protein involved in type VI secretion